ncbi:hypothetical protein HK096_005180 [Nowakowskiella sp. JEL0078]|nr:hypothetical protein HK096_005180 [Nowakowskiella sp. JEL0078]
MKFGNQASQIALTLFCVLLFPASWVFVHFLMVNKQWCFADFCVESMGSRRVPVRNTLAIYYSFIAFVAIVAFFSARVSSVRRFVSHTVFSTLTITVGELAFFILAIILTSIVVPAIIWTPYFNMWAATVPKTTGMDMTMNMTMTMASSKIDPSNWTWIRLVYETLILVTGDILALLLGLSILPVSKNSILGKILDLPYTTTVRIHRWIGYSIFWITIIHLLITMMASAMDPKPVYQLFFTISKDASIYGSLNYIYITGFISFFFLAIVIGTSLPYIRRNFFNTFYWTHFLIFLSVAAAYIHASMSIFYMIPGLILYTMDVFIRIYNSFTYTSIVSVVMEDSGLITLTAKFDEPVGPGEFMRVKLASVSNFEFHPWSAIPNNNGTLSFVFSADSSHPKEWSYKAMKSLSENPNQSISLQGPYGKKIQFTANKTREDVLVFYVGGTGIAPAIAAISSILGPNVTESDPHVKQGKDSEQGNYTAVNADGTRIFLFWAASSEKINNFSLIQPWLEPNSPVTVQLFDTSASAIESKSSLINQHRPHLKGLLNKFISPFTDDNSKIGVFLCGPEGFVKDALLSIETFKKKNKNVRVTVEIESFAL